jgi:hypothetical protein
MDHEMVVLCNIYNNNNFKCIINLSIDITSRATRSCINWNADFKEKVWRNDTVYVS